MNVITVEQEVSIFERLMVAPESAEALLSLRFSAEDENRMRDLMEKNNQGTLSSVEQSQMEAFRQIGSFLAVVQAKARLQLAGQGRNSAA